MSDKSKSKRILLIMPEFYGLESKIKLALESIGNDVVWINNKNIPLDYHGTRAKFRLLRRLYFFLFSPRVRFLQKQFRKIENPRFDTLLAINAHVICRFLFKKLKKHNPNIYSVLYLWDSHSMYSWEKESRLFDVIYSFDRLDSGNYGYKYYPNFFAGNRISDDKVGNDLIFIGKFSSERFRVLDRIIDQLSESKVRLFFRVLPEYKNLLHNRYLYKFLKIIRLKTGWVLNYLLNYEVTEGILKRDYIISERIDYEDVQKEIMRSNVVLDIPFIEQSGYSHRLIGALAGGKKVITTNQYIQKESFYDPDQIHIIKSDDPVIEISWVKQKKVFQQNGYFNNLELTSWLEYLLKNAVA